MSARDRDKIPLSLAAGAESAAAAEGTSCSRNGASSPSRIPSAASRSSSSNPEISQSGGRPGIRSNSTFYLWLLQGDQAGQQLYFVDFELVVPPCCLHHAMQADIRTTKSKSTKCSYGPDGSPCTAVGEFYQVIAPQILASCKCQILIHKISHTMKCL